MAGMYPVLPRPDGLCFRVRDIANAGGTAQVFVSFPPVGAGFVPGISLQFQAIAFGITPQPRLSNAQRTVFF